MQIRPKLTTLSILTLVVVFVVQVSFVSSVKGAAEVHLLSHTGYVDSFGYYHVVGEVQNVGDQTVTLVTIFVTFYDSQGIVVDTRFDLAMLNVILVDRKSPFDVVLLDSVQSAIVDHYGVNMTFSTTSPIPAGLEILSTSSQVDAFGRLHILGQIENVGTATANNVKIVATGYDENGLVVAAAYAYTDPEERSLDSGLTASFEIIFPEERSPIVSRYEVTCESWQYAAIYELQWWALILMSLVFTSALAICKRKMCIHAWRLS